MTDFLQVIPAWLELVFLTSFIGALVCRLYVIGDLGASALFQSEISARFRLLFRISIPVIIVCAVSDLLIGAAEMSGRPVDEVFSFVPTVVLKTHFGRVWVARIISLLLLLAATWVGRRYGESRGALHFMLGLGLIVAMSESASGHASDAGDFSVPEIADLLHLVAASLWGGGLFALAVVILPILKRQNDRTSIAGAAVRFSRMGGYAVGIIAVTSFYNAWSYVGSVEALLKTAYGLTAAVKTLLFFLLVLLGAFNRYVSVPLLRERTGLIKAKGPGIIDHFASKLLSRVRGAQDGRHIVVRFLRLVRIEAVLVVAVLFCAALLRHEVPARHLLHLEHARAGVGHADHGHMHDAADQEAVSVRLETDPEQITVGIPVSMTVRLENRRGGPLHGLKRHHERILHALIIGSDLDVFAHIHPEDLGVITGTMLDTASFPLQYTFPKAGDYLIGLDFATEDGLYSRTVHLRVTGRPGMGPAGKDFSRAKNFGPYQVSLTTLSGDIKAGRETTLRYTVRKDGKPVTDLEPYLGAAMHLAIVRSDLTHFIHAHGSVPGEGPAADREHAQPPEKFGPEIESTIVFPVKGAYRIFSQVQHQGKVLLFDFMVEAR